MTIHQLQTRYDESLRYMDNAKEILQKAKKQDAFYQDVKYVKSACGIAYSGLLLALDTLFEYKGISNLPKGRKKSIEYYQSTLSKIDKKMLSHLNSGYEILHIWGYYEGTENAVVIQEGFKMAYAIIEKIKPAHD